MAALPHGQLLKVHQASTAVGLTDSRDALLVGIDPALVSGLTRVPKPADQLLCDLNSLNMMVPLRDGITPLELWLQNAIHLSGPRAEASVFGDALDKVRASIRSVLETPPSESNVPDKTPHDSPDHLDGTGGFLWPDIDEMASADEHSSVLDVAFGHDIQGHWGVHGASGGEFTAVGTREGFDAPTQVLGRLAAVGALRGDIAEAKKRWERLLATASPDLIARWLAAFERIPSDAGAATLHIASMWKNAADLGLVPRIQALEGRPNIDDFGQFCRSKKVAWCCKPREKLEPIGPQAQAHMTDYGWLDGAWSSSHVLAGPLFEITWDTLYVLHNDKLLSGNVALPWWHAAGGVVDGDQRAIVPWPGIDLPMFSAFELLTQRWNHAYAMAAKLYRLIPDNGAVDDLAHWYVNYCHNLWHKNIDIKWTTEVTLRDWKDTVSCLLRAANGTQASRDGHYAVWARALPIFAAPESGLSIDVASAILEAASLDASRKQELRELRSMRLRECLSTRDEKEIISALNARHREHPWTRHVEEHGS